MINTIKFTNKNGESITFKQYAPYIFRDITGLGNNAIKAETDKGYGQQGVYLYGVNEGARVIDIQCRFMASSEVDVDAKRRELSRILNPRLGKGEILIDKGVAKYKIGAQVILKAEFERIPKTYSQDFSVTFLCPKPDWLSEERTKIKMVDFVGGLKFPIKFPIKFADRGSGGKVDYYGDNPAPVILDFRVAEGGTSFVDPLITNDLGQYIKLKRTITEGQRVLIDTNPDARSVLLIDNGIVSKIGYVHGSTFFQLHRGENIFTFAVESGDPELFLEYEEHYAGI